MLRFIGVFRICSKAIRSSNGQFKRRTISSILQSFSRIDLDLFNLLKILEPVHIDHLAARLSYLAIRISGYVRAIMSNCYFASSQVLSYNGHLSFRVRAEGGTPFPDSVFETYPLVQLQGNFRLVLEFYPKNLAPDGRYDVRLHEVRALTNDTMLILIHCI